MILESGIDCKGNEYQKIELGKAKDWTNQRVGKLLVLFRVKILNKNHGKQVYWLTKCDCGNIYCCSSNKFVPSHNTQGCGCVQRQLISEMGKLSRKNLTNLIHNNIRFLRFNPTYKEEHFITSRNAYWDCECYCGNIFTANANEILRNKITSCGCKANRKSNGEKTIENILIKNNIKYVFDKGYFHDLILPTGGIGRYDFILINDNNEPYRIIEFDGNQHFSENNIFDYHNENNFSKRQRNDEVKNLYALNKGIPLVRIPYHELKNITLELLLDDKYLITQ